MDLDGLYAGAKWVLGGIEPYPGADADARAVDTRRGEPGPIATRIDRALRARFRDETLKYRVIQYLLARTQSPHHWEEIERAARLIDPLLDQARKIAERYQIEGNVAYVEARSSAPYDKTELLLLGQQRAAVAVVRDSDRCPSRPISSPGWISIKLFDLGGGMPTRVSVPESRLEEVMQKLAEAVKGKGGETR